MHFAFMSKEDWYRKHPGLKEKFDDTYSTISVAALKWAKAIGESVKAKVEEDITIELSGQCLEQALIDAFDDLIRLKKYHPISEPNPIKEMAYIVYWFLKRKPLRLATEGAALSPLLSKEKRVILQFPNEEFCVNMLMNSAFEGRRQVENCSHIFDFAKKQVKYFKQFLLYYLSYRLDSPKSLEAIMLGCTIHPIWEVNSVIWANPEALLNNN